MPQKVDHSQAFAVCDDAQTFTNSGRSKLI